MDGQDQKREAFLDALGELAHSVSNLRDLWNSLSRKDSDEVNSLEWSEVMQMSMDEMPSELFAFIDQLSAIWGV